MYSLPSVPQTSCGVKLQSRASGQAQTAVGPSSLHTSYALHLFAVHGSLRNKQALVFFTLLESQVNIHTF